VDAKVTRLFRLADRVGARVAVRTPATRVRPEDAAPVAPGDATALLGTLVSRAAVLLRNTGLLPLPAGLRRVALIGPNAVRFAAQGGGSAHVSPPHLVDLAVGLRRALAPDVALSVHAGVYPWRGLPELEPAAPLTVRFRDAAGTELGSQQRTAARWVFLPGPHGLPAGTAEVAVSGAVLPAVTGTHQLAVQGLGRYTLEVAGGRTEHRLDPPDGDVFGGFLRPPQAVVEVPLRAGVPTPFTLRHEVPDGVPFAAFGLGHAPPRGTDAEELAAAMDAARDADVAVVVVGTSAEVEGEGFDRDTLALPGRQDELVSAVAAVNPRTVVVVNAGAPVTMPWRDEVAAVLWGWLPGQEGGTGLADVLVGRAEPGGRLPTTLPAVEADMPVPGTAPVDGVIEYGPLIGYREYAARGTVPAYPFGHGLGYTSWEYERMDVTTAGAGGLRIAVTVRNSGERPGREVVQCYREEDPLRLVGFAAVRAGPGERATVVIDVAARTLERWDGGWRPRQGGRRIAAGRSAGDLRLWGQAG
jgi:beta-glucosidase